MCIELIIPEWILASSFAQAVKQSLGLNYSRSSQEFLVLLEIRDGAQTILNGVRTQKEEPLLRRIEISLLTLLIGSVVVGCAAPAPTTAPTVMPTSTVLPTATSEPTLQPSDTERNVMVNDLERSYLLHVPPGVDGVHPVPVVFAFHGLGSQPGDLQITTGLNEIADSNGFLMVYPKGLQSSWNGGEGCCGYAETANIDEAAFVRQMLSDLGASFSVDSRRIYALGFSNGAVLAYRLACEMSDTFAGVAPVAGNLQLSPCEPQEPVSIIHMHGLRDEDVPYQGGGPLSLLPIEQLISEWARLDGCPDTPQVDESTKFVKHISYSACKAGSAVELYAIEIGYHVWPSDPVLPGSQIIWDFFAAHPKP
jgi:polyhydroxybutyrate depolymerase